jgi:hypothetical protein
MNFPWLSNPKPQNRLTNSISSTTLPDMTTSLTQYGRMAEKHWREHLPKLVQELEAKGQLHEVLLEAEEKTKDEMYQTLRDLQKQGYTPQQAHDAAWEIVREKYILLPQEQA